MQYRYDSMGNIVEILENGCSACRCEYDALGRLTREDNVAFGKTTTWAYDNNGNIIARYEYAITTKPTSELHLINGTCKLYNYDDNSDQLMSYNGEAFEYDVIGNPTTYRGKNATWQYGRQLTAYNGNTFSYNARGRRIGKNGITFTYDSNGNLIKQSNGLEFLYDHTGVFAVKHGEETYFYRKDAQSNIVELLDSSGDTVVKYKYDAWGNCQTTVVDSTASTVAELNPFRYRSYYFDTETGFYFLKTRYYDPEIGRFMTIDDISYLDPEFINGLNLYAYCLNNPIKYSDPNGTSITLGVILGIVALAGLITTCIGVGTDNNLVTAIGLTMVAVPALISGGLALVGGITAKAALTAIIGGVTTLAGIGTGLFASAEYQEAFTGNNWILATTGMSEGLYNGLMIAIATIAIAGTFASSFMRAFNIRSIQKIGRFGKYGQKGYRGIKFTTGNRKTRVLTFHTHSHIDGKSISQWHWQLQKWNPKAKEAAGTLGQWIWWNLREI